MTPRRWGTPGKIDTFSHHRVKWEVRTQNKGEIQYKARSAHLRDRPAVKPRESSPLLCKGKDVLSPTYRRTQAQRGSIADEGSLAQ